MIAPVRWDSQGAVLLLDQRKLPAEETWVRCTTHQEVAASIRAMVVRGAPAIGIAAAYGVALGVRRSAAEGPELAKELDAIAGEMRSTRPTAVNLFWALDRMVRRFAGAPGLARREAADLLLREAQVIEAEDLAACRRMGDLGASLIPEGACLLTHCNAGGLATAGYGTALGVIRSAAREGKVRRVFADETRPYLQGARLTAWELLRDGIETTLIADSMAGHLMARGEIDAVVVGADRIAANGDVANKIGTYSVAVLAKENGVPFYVVAPVSTLDAGTPSGDHIDIEERSEDEITHHAGVRVAPEGVAVRNPAFDITPHRFVTAIVTERGIAFPPYGPALRILVEPVAAL